MEKGNILKTAITGYFAGGVFQAGKTTIGNNNILFGPSSTLFPGKTRHNSASIDKNNTRSRLLEDFRYT